MSITNLGKKNHKVIRVSGTGDYVDGEYLEAPEVELSIRANIQPAMSSFRTQLLPEGDRTKKLLQSIVMIGYTQLEVVHTLTVLITHYLVT